MRHLTVRVAWHDNVWNGRVCASPAANAYCVALERIRDSRDDAYEVAVANSPFGNLKELPPCAKESGVFMNTLPWSRPFVHPYRDNPKTAATHGQLQQAIIQVPPYSTFAVPFWWMLNDHQREAQDALPTQLPPDTTAPFESAWVFGQQRQEALLEHVFGQLETPGSIGFFYTKEGHPLDDRINRLIVGVGDLTSIGPLLRYPSSTKATLPLWDRLIGHGIRPTGGHGVLLPYHAYLAPTGDPDEDRRRRELLSEITFAPDDDQIRTFSYAAELATSDTALALLLRLLAIVRKVRAHGIADGDWLQREEWINDRIAAMWRNRGAFPGLGSVLEAIGLRLGTALTMDLLSSGRLKTDEDPWQLMDAILRGYQEPPRAEYAADIAATRNTWIGLGAKRRRLLALLSRFDIAPAQARRWFDEVRRNRSTWIPVDDASLLSNPYRIAEADLGDPDSPAVSIGTLDRGAYPDAAIRDRHPLPADPPIASPMDHRRVRAAFVDVLRAALRDGNTFLTVVEAVERVGSLRLSPPIDVLTDWLAGNKADLAGTLKQFGIPTPAGPPVDVVQLTEVAERESRLSKVLLRRAQTFVPTTQSNWHPLLVEAIAATGAIVDPADPRHATALDEQAEALERVTTRRASALVGAAGTGKTAALGALLRSAPVRSEGILLLAPTGKARVRLGQAVGQEAQTVAQFLYQLGRYDGKRQRPLLDGPSMYHQARTVVIDEASMLTLDDLVAITNALDLTHVLRLILVGDPNQLPPIGSGRPFVDFVALLERPGDDPTPSVREALGLLETEVRSVAGAPSATLKLASWFRRGAQPPGADRILSEVAAGERFNDLELCYWDTPADLEARLSEQLERHLELTSADDVIGFNRALGIDEKGLVPWDAPDGAEAFQILSPVRMRPFGVYELNRWIQSRFRSAELAAASQPWVPSLGDERIVIRDKVIQTRNERRAGYDGTASTEAYLANGEVGIVGPGRNRWLNVHFAHRPGVSFGYRNGRDFPGGSGPLELAYALTVHKAQGSDFDLVLVVLPAGLGFLTRELIYTALTRAKTRLVLLVQGQDPSMLFELSRQENSEAAARNTNMFDARVRRGLNGVPYPEGLIHTTEKGHLVRSKSEIVISNKLFELDIPYDYEKSLTGVARKGRVLPDFTIETPSGDVLIWEHLGRLDKADYVADWEWKREWYAANGFVEGQTLFITRDSPAGALNMAEITACAEAIRQAL